MQFLGFNNNKIKWKATLYFLDIRQLAIAKRYATAEPYVQETLNQ